MGEICLYTIYITGICEKKPNTPNPITHFSGVLSFRVWGFGVFGFFSQITCDILQSPEIF